MALQTTGFKLSICKQCTTQIANGEDHIACEGFCHNAFHARCVKLNADTLLSCRTSPNVWWTCGSCTHLMRTMRNGHPSFANRKEDASTPRDDCGNPREERCSADRAIVETSEDTVRDVREELFLIKQQIAAIHDSVDRMTYQRENSFDPSVNTSSSPLSSTKLMQGSRRDEEFELSCDADVGDRFWLFFTKIKNTTTEKQIYDMVTKALGERSGSHVIVKKLVPFWKDTSTMPYISYKVGLDPALKHAALIPSTWPSGICYRQFINVCN